jgi:hypothetical protein
MNAGSDTGPGNAGDDALEAYVLRLLDECRDEIKFSDSKASILFGAVAFVLALLVNPAIDDQSAVRASGAAVVVPFVIAIGILGLAMFFLGMAIVPRLGHAQAGKARYFEEQAQFDDDASLLAVVTADAASSADRHASQLRALARTASRKYRCLRYAMQSMCVAAGVLLVTALIAAVD